MELVLEENLASLSRAVYILSYIYIIPTMRINFLDKQLL